MQIYVLIRKKYWLADGTMILDHVLSSMFSICISFVLKIHERWTQNEHVCRFAEWSAMDVVFGNCIAIVSVGNAHDACIAHRLWSLE